MSDYTKWVAMWGNAVSITENKPAAYAKDITLRYPIYCPFDGGKLRLTFDNYCGTEAVTITKTTVLSDGTFYPVTFEDKEQASMPAGENIVSDEIEIPIKRGQTIWVSFYLGDFTQMRSSVYVQGPLSGGQYAMGDHTLDTEFDIEISRKTNIDYFLSNISILTEENNHALVCYGDSITAQDWPDHLQLMLQEGGIQNLSVIRRATSGSRILRQYSCITYESYGLMGKNRFEHEVPTDGADMLIIQQGINDIIHPVGTDVNVFRPMSDMPTLDELIQGMEWYLERAKEYGYKTYLGTLLPIEGWRTYADFREVIKNDFNDFMRKTPLADGVIDFDKAVQDTEDAKRFLPTFDSGDHLHPSSAGYKQMAKEAFEHIKEWT